MFYYLLLQLRRASSLTALEDISTTVHREQHRQHHARSSVRHRVCIVTGGMNGYIIKNNIIFISL